MNWVIAPILIPLITGLLALVFGQVSLTRRVLVAGSAVVQVGVAVFLLNEVWGSGILVLGVGNWTPPIGIALVLDLLAAIMMVLSTFVALVCLLFSYADCSTKREHPLRLPLVQFLIVGIHLSFLTGDLFNLFVAFEIMLIASYALLTLECDDWEVKQAFPYISINLFGSALFLIGAGAIYATFGTLNMADLAVRVPLLGDDPRITIFALLFLVVFLIKSGVFPFFYWLPASYPVLPASLAALFAGLLTKVGVYVIIRMFGTILPSGLETAYLVMIVLAGATMGVGILCSISQKTIRGIFVYNIVSHMGYMIAAIGFASTRALTACLVYMIHDILVKSSLFLLNGTAARLNGTDELKKMGGLWKVAPWFGVCFLLQSLSLVGVPPLSGFWGKLMIFEEGIRSGHYVIVALVVFASVLTLVGVLVIWNEAFWKKSEGQKVDLENKEWSRMAWVSAILVLATVMVGLGAEGVITLASSAAEMALDREGYAEAVLSQFGKGRLE